MVADKGVLPVPEEPEGGGDVGDGQASAALRWWCKHQQLAGCMGELVPEPDIHHSVEPYVLGKLVKLVFYRSYLCLVELRRAHIGKPVLLNQTCFDGL